jgi:NAD(P)-dependent dehydrogenase (short-subunit alcohol dehydrogenase family)
MNVGAIFDLSDRTALVVGAGGGIGRAAVLGLSAHGAHVVCADVDEESNEETLARVREGGGEGGAITLDTCDSEQIEEVLEVLPPLDILVYTPAVNMRVPLLDLSEDEFDRMIELNLKGAFLAMRAVARGMAQRGRGSIIAFSSVRADVVEPGQGVYAATMSGLRQLCRTLAVELGPYGVRVNCIAPGPVETNMTEQIRARAEWYDAYAAKTVLQRWAKPEEMAGAVVFLASDASTYVTGSVLYVDGGWTAADGRFLPPV